MVSLIESDQEEVGNLDNVRKQLREAVAERGGPEPGKETPEQREERERKVRVIEVNDEELPERMRGKDIKDIVEMYKNLESQYGRVANDLGTQRQLTDRLLNLKRESDLQRNTEQPSVKVDVNEVLENPTEAIEKIVAARLARQEAERREQEQQLAMQTAQQQFLSRHADYQDIASDPSFVEWVRATPYRQRTANYAAQGDWAAADELLTEYKELRTLRQRTKQKQEQEEEDENLKAARAASLEKSNSESAKGKGGRIYRRAELLKLQLEDPDTYYNDEFQAEILRAYAEKRVR